MGAGAGAESYSTATLTVLLPYHKTRACTKNYGKKNGAVYGTTGLDPGVAQNGTGLAPEGRVIYGTGRDIIS